jgi:hypothetical protein
MQIKEFEENLKFLPVVEEQFSDVAEFRKEMHHLAIITLFTKTNENIWRCELQHKDLKISAAITIDAAYPEIPPIFKLEQVRTKRTD